MLVPVFTFGLFLLSCLSPLLTFTYLWQVKEWRWDRLREHLNREGWVIPLAAGKTRLALAAILLLLAGLDLIPAAYLVDAFLSVFALMTIAQITLRRQPLPVWTSKAITLTGCALLGTSILGILLLILPRGTAFLPPIVFLQPIILFVAWSLFWPLDRFLKQRTFARARALRLQHPELLVIGITGSVGKTTTKELLAHVLGDKQPLATPAHVNSEMGVARWLLQTLTPSTMEERILIVEMGAYRPGEIATLCSIVRPSIGIVTYIGSQHLALFGSQEALARAKGELIRSLPSNGHAFLNGDCVLCESILPSCPCPASVIGTGGSRDLEAFDIEETPTGIRFRVGETPFSVPLHGTHNVTNALLTISAAEYLGMSRSLIAERLRTFRPPHRTFEVRLERGVTILDDTHNASAASFKAAIAWADTQPFERKVLLTGGLMELGTEHERTHRELGSLCTDVFEEVYFLARTNTARIFEEGFGKPIIPLPRKPFPLPPSTLLICVGRMSPETIRKLLPTS